MIDTNEKIRVLERMRWQETKISRAAEPLQRVLLEQVTDKEARNQLTRVEQWWQDLPNEVSSLADIPVVNAALEHLTQTGCSITLPRDTVTQGALSSYVAEVRALTELRQKLS